jgi:hypothetical protein
MAREVRCWRCAGEDDAADDADVSWWRWFLRALSAAGVMTAPRVMLMLRAVVTSNEPRARLRTRVTQSDRESAR